MAKIDDAMEKWMDNTLANKDLWISMVKDARDREAFISGVAEFTGYSESTVRAATPTGKWRKFANSPRDFVDDFTEGVREAYEAETWKKKYKAAFGGA